MIELVKNRLIAGQSFIRTPVTASPEAALRILWSRALSL
jgi:hypothetical protein